MRPASPKRKAGPAKVGFVSLGCPKALVDSERILTELRAEGYVVAPSYADADLVVVNTCGFIDAAVEESLDAIGEALAENGKVIVTGCLGAKGSVVKDAHPRVLAVTGLSQRGFKAIYANFIDGRVPTQQYGLAVASGDTGMQTGVRSIGGTIGFELFDQHNVDELARRAAEQALTKLRARPAPSGSMPVVIKCGTGGVLFHEACGHGLEADLVAKGASVYAGRRGEQVASSLITLVDDGTMSGEWGAIGYDDEGHASQYNVLIQDGVLTDYMWDYLRARKEGRAQSGNGRRQSYQHLPMVRMTNTFVLNGPHDPDAIVRDTKHGVYVAKLGGGNPLELALSINVGAAIVDVSPLSTTGALCVAALPASENAKLLFRRLLIWGFSMTIVGALFGQFCVRFFV